MENIATFAGYSVTIGTVASVLTQYVKKSWFPHQYRALLCRLLVAVVCVVLQAGAAYIEGVPLGLETTIGFFFSYAVAAAEYDHLWK